jgi:hypothetical protein
MLAERIINVSPMAKMSQPQVAEQPVPILTAPLHIKLSGHLQRGGTNDLWTAATAIAKDPVLPIVTNNLRDFRTIAAASEGLLVVHQTLDPRVAATLSAA